jgi:hypothetical protein
VNEQQLSLSSSFDTVARYRRTIPGSTLSTTGPFRGIRDLLEPERIEHHYCRVLETTPSLVSATEKLLDFAHHLIDPIGFADDIVLINVSPANNSTLRRRGRRRRRRRRRRIHTHHPSRYPITQQNPSG